MVNSIITRGYGYQQRVITQGYGYGPSGPWDDGKTAPDALPIVGFPPIVANIIRKYNIKGAVYKKLLEYYTSHASVYELVSGDLKAHGLVYEFLKEHYRLKNKTIEQIRGEFDTKATFYKNAFQKINLNGKESYKLVGEALDERFLSVLIELYKRRKRNE